jgi:hypothetical protein
MITVKKLFDYEMGLPTRAVLHFRTLAMMIACVEMFNGKRQQARQASKGSNNVQAFERVNIAWKDILIIHTTLFEVSYLLLFISISLIIFMIDTRGNFSKTNYQGSR